MAKKKSTEKIAGGITQAQLDEFKRNNPEGVHKLEIVVEKEEKDEKGKVVKEAETATIYLRDPFNKPELVTEMLALDTKAEMQEYILGRLYLGGDKDAVFKNKRAKFWASVRAYGLVELNDMNLKKV